MKRDIFNWDCPAWNSISLEGTFLVLSVLESFSQFSSPFQVGKVKSPDSMGLWPESIHIWQSHFEKNAWL